MTKGAGFLRRFIAITVFLLAGSLVLVACGGSDDSSDSMNMSYQSGMHHGSDENQPVVAGAPEVVVEAGELSFTPKRLELTAGEDVTIVLTSTDIEHDVYVDGVGHIVHAAAGRTAKGGLVIDEPGTYRFWCTITGHKQGGMVGTIVVSA